MSMCPPSVATYTAIVDEMVLTDDRRSLTGWEQNSGKVGRSGLGGEAGAADGMASVRVCEFFEAVAFGAGCFGR
jgi:hypothetical protein